MYSQNLPKMVFKIFFNWFKNISRGLLGRNQIWFPKIFKGLIPNPLGYSFEFAAPNWRFWRAYFKNLLPGCNFLNQNLLKIVKRNFQSEGHPGSSHHPPVCFKSIGTAAPTASVSS